MKFILGLIFAILFSSCNPSTDPIYLKMKDTGFHLKEIKKGATSIYILRDKEEDVEYIIVRVYYGVAITKREKRKTKR